ncbi:MobA/MobL family protein [Bosea sp. ANAM02]|uniref:MobA/MobL family protein n=1 Tax=Bosea sp. ANAM02 TaxID=2020412 RepID=UPI00140EF0DD|nr:MobA/MobL family protein [Bosea sp. ANAM02]BCB18587.1 hypothetical protein OCUBac02_14810 [Bosea sp. ANAM02]
MAREVMLEDVDGRTRGLLAPSRHALDRVLAKALARAEERARRNVEQAIAHNPIRDAGFAADRMSAAIARAVRTEFPTIGLTPTKRRPMPDTGGMSFHFGHTSVTERSTALKPGQTHWCRNGFGHAYLGKDINYTSQPGAHQLYIERRSAVERVLEGEEPGRMQAYIEDPEKVGGNREADIGPTEFSFGTTGKTEAERLEFWRLAHKYPERANGIIQHRFILQLPKEASATERLAIVKAFVAPFDAPFGVDDDRKIPYWAALHAPTADNDPRNFHAHVIVFNRPTKMIPWPEGGDDGSTDRRLVPTWDFAAVRRIRTKHRNYRDQFPMRQDVPKLLRGRFVQRERERFAGLVNAEMEKAGKAIRYDHRSYAEAGILDVEPERKAGYARKIVRRDRDLSLHDVADEIGGAAVRSSRKDQTKALGALDHLITSARNAPDEFVRIMRSVPTFSRADARIDWSRATSSASRQLAIEAAERQKAALHLRVAQAGEAATLDALIASTRQDSSGRHRDRLQRELKTRTTETRHRSVHALDELPTAEVANDVHEAAREERAAHAKAAQEARDRADRAVRFALEAWARELEPREVEAATAAPSIAPPPASRSDRSYAEKILQEALAVRRRQEADGPSAEERRQQERRKAILSNPGRRGGKGYGE